MRTLLLLALAGCSQSTTMMMQNVADDLSMNGDLAGAPANADLAGPPPPPDLAGYVTADMGLIAARPYPFYVPPGYNKNTPTPLVILLHGYTVSGAEQEAYWQLKEAADAHTFLYAYPDGTVDFLGNRFWNATDACCDIGHTGVDDVAYINAIIDDVVSKYNVDPKRIFVTGHSNGGFMSHRLACDAPRVAAIVSMAGAQWLDASQCNPAGKVAVLEIHGDVDTVINYNGGTNTGLGTYPSAMQTVATWAAKNGCTGLLTDSGMTMDLDGSVMGNETQVWRYGGCPAHGEVELWTMHGSGHVPVPLVQPAWAEALYGFLSSHPKP
jgi:polyhydroxybutyrate depolymerase